MLQAFIRVDVQARSTSVHEPTEPICLMFRHALPLFTSLLNTVCGYIPGGILPYNHLIWSDSKENLVEIALQVRDDANNYFRTTPLPPFGPFCRSMTN